MPDGLLVVADGGVTTTDDTEVGVGGIGGGGAGGYRILVLHLDDLAVQTLVAVVRNWLSDQGGGNGGPGIVIIRFPW